MSQDDEIQVNLDLETKRLLEFHEKIMTGSYSQIIKAWEIYRMIIERILKHSARMDSHLMDFHEIRNKEKHILVSKPNGFEIIDVSDECSSDMQ